MVPLDPSCYHLTTFITPFGRFRFKRLPFGINSEPEHFPRQMHGILKGLHGVTHQADDIVVYGRCRRSSAVLGCRELYDEVSKPLRELLEKRREYRWSSVHTAAFEELKNLLTSPPNLANYNPKCPLRVAANASSCAIGSVLEQQGADGWWRPVVCASRSMTECERRYSQVEREALVLTWACEKFEYISSL